MNRVELERHLRANGCYLHPLPSPSLPGRGEVFGNLFEAVVFRHKVNCMTTETAVAAGSLARWTTNNLPEPPRSGWTLWAALIVAFVAIAGAGGMTNTMFSNDARDNGWGMRLRRYCRRLSDRWNRRTTIECATREWLKPI
jgi:hypothetical protein